MINIVIHKWRKTRKTKMTFTYGFISIIKGDVLDMFDRAAIERDRLLGYKRQINDYRI